MKAKIDNFLTFVLINFLLRHYNVQNPYFGFVSCEKMKKTPSKVKYFNKNLISFWAAQLFQKQNQNDLKPLNAGLEEWTLSAL